MTGDVGQAFVAAAVQKGQIGMIQPHEVENGGVDVVDVGSAIDRFQADFVGAPVDCAGLDPATCEPHAEARGVMIASAAAFLAHGGAPKLATPDHQRFVQQPASARGR